MYENFSRCNQVFAAFYEFAFYTGTRTGEIMALRWDEIDFEKKTAHVCRIVVEKQVVERTKTKYTRTVMLNSRALVAGQGQGNRSLQIEAEATSLDRIAIHLPTVGFITTHHRARVGGQALQPGGRSEGAQTPPPVQLPAHLCHDVPHVRDESGVHCRAAWSLGTSPPLHLREMAKFCERLG
ncbi:tyrosine-type recombinase/integrase [Pseudomonas sp. UBA4617]|uniref:tyrosine-type recombinase/integrase n=1 Tax=Pseudomonas sp. UBA4617 TaxID=1947318 RepID=UPI0025F1BA50|nr:tyrosine-type recombinase/integrase [Pseudomonas sp. UBA4617]